MTEPSLQRPARELERLLRVSLYRRTATASKSIQPVRNWRAASRRADRDLVRRRGDRRVTSNVARRPARRRPRAVAAHYPGRCSDRTAGAAAAAEDRRYRGLVRKARTGAMLWRHRRHLWRVARAADPRRTYRATAVRRSLCAGLPGIPSAGRQSVVAPRQLAQYDFVLPPGLAATGGARPDAGALEYQAEGAHRDQLSQHHPCAPAWQRPHQPAVALAR